MPARVLVTTGSRLHFGLLTNAAVTGRKFGGIGMMVEAPGFRLRLERASRDEIDASPYWRDRMIRALDQCRNCLRGPSCRLTLETDVPPHRGFGSGTQLALAVLSGLNALAGGHPLTPWELARFSGRGKRSAIGLHGFLQGGFLVDGGKSHPDSLPPLLCRVEFPPDWRMLLVIPSDQTGLHGSAEQEAFRQLPPTPLETQAELCRLVLMELLPALHEAEFAACGEALYQFGQLVGHSFGPVQPLPFASREMHELAQELRRQGVPGIAQTSWGPTLCILCPSEADALALRDEYRPSPWGHCTWQLTRPLNRGAEIRLEI